MKTQKPTLAKVTISLDFHEAQALRDLILSAKVGFNSVTQIANKLTDEHQTDRALTIGIHKTIYGKDNK